jgi:hypothetical protein
MNAGAEQNSRDETMRKTKTKEIERLCPKHETMRKQRQKGNKKSYVEK